MTEDPFSAKNLIASAYMAIVAGGGGLLSYYQKVKKGEARPFNVPEILGEVIISAAVGILTFWICKGLEVNEWLTAAGVAITGHMGARAIFIAEKSLESMADKWTNK